MNSMAHPNAQSINDLLTDPLVQKVMLADRVDPTALRALMTGVADRLAEKRSAGSVVVRQDLGRRAAARAFLPPARPATRPSGEGCGFAICC
jgi:hypothetical protein